MNHVINIWLGRQNVLILKWTLKTQHAEREYDLKLFIWCENWCTSVVLVIKVRKKLTN